MEKEPTNLTQNEIAYYSHMFKKWKIQVLKDEPLFVNALFIYSAKIVNNKITHFNPLFRITDLSKFGFWERVTNTPLYSEDLNLNSDIFSESEKINNDSHQMKQINFSLTPRGYKVIKKILEDE